MARPEGPKRCRAAIPSRAACKSKLSISNVSRALTVDARHRVRPWRAHGSRLHCCALPENPCLALSPGVACRGGPVAVRGHACTCRAMRGGCSGGRGAGAGGSLACVRREVAFAARAPRHHPAMYGSSVRCVRRARGARAALATARMMMHCSALARVSWTACGLGEKVTRVDIRSRTVTTGRICYVTHNGKLFRYSCCTG